MSNLFDKSRGLCAWSLNIQENSIRWSESLFHLFGFEASQDAPDWKNHSILYSSDSFVRLEKAVHECLKTGLGYIIDLEAIHQTGKILQLEAQGVAHRNEKGEIIGLSGVLIDRSAMMSAEERFRAIADYTVDWESWIGLDGRYLWVNPAVERFTGYTPDEVLAMPDYLTTLVDPEDLQMVREHRDEALSGLTRDSLEFRCLRKDGSKFWIGTEWQSIFDREGNHLGLRISGRDITERVLMDQKLCEAEESARRKSERLKAILESPEKVIIFALDSEYRYTEFTKAHAETIKKIWGIEIELGMNMLDCIGRPDDRKKAKNHFDRALNGEHLVIEEEYGDTNLHRLFYKCHYSPVLNEDGEIEGLSVFVIDITEKVAVSRSLIERNAILEALTEASELGQLIVDNQGRKLFQNKKFTELYEIPKSIVTSEDNRIQLEWCAACTNDPEGFLTKIKYLYDHPLEGSTDELELKKGIIIERYSKPFLDHEGKVLGRIWIFNDVTQERTRELVLKQHVEKATSADRAKSEFLGVMSHELRTPLNGILGYASLILSNQQLPSEAEDQIRLIQASGESLLRILQDILDFSRADGGDIDLLTLPFSLSELAWQAVRIMEVDARAKNLELIVVLGENLPGTVIGDTDRIRQVLLNLLRNAIKFTSQGKISLIITKGKEEEICFSVEDTGIGVSEEDAARIFLPFTQADSTMSRQHDGIGLGLSISKRLVEKMGSELRLKSRLGEGSSFNFTLNLPVISSTSLPPKELEDDLGELNKEFAKRFPISILVVEDTPTNLKLIVMMLGKLGFQDILTATNGEEALQMVKENKIELIFMDLQMPGIDGIEATKKIRIEEKNQSLEPKTIVALTANVSTAIRNECFTAGMDDYISKPFNTRALARAISRTAAISR